MPLEYSIELKDDSENYHSYNWSVKTYDLSDPDPMTDIEFFELLFGGYDHYTKTDFTNFTIFDLADFSHGTVNLKNGEPNTAITPQKYEIKHAAGFLLSNSDYFTSPNMYWNLNNTLNKEKYGFVIGVYIYPILGANQIQLTITNTNNGSSSVYNIDILCIYEGSSYVLYLYLSSDAFMENIYLTELKPVKFYISYRVIKYNVDDIGTYGNQFKETVVIYSAESSQVFSNTVKLGDPVVLDNAVMEFSLLNTGYSYLIVKEIIYLSGGGAWKNSFSIIDSGLILGGFGKFLNLACEEGIVYLPDSDENGICKEVRLFTNYDRLCVNWDSSNGVFKCLKCMDSQYLDIYNGSCELDNECQMTGWNLR